MIQIEQVTKRFGDIVALNDVDAQIGENCIFGLVGTNGAGKSTLLRVIAGVLKPEEGQVRIDELPVWENPLAKRRIGWFYSGCSNVFSKCHGGCDARLL